jgi:hypothetical protein
VVRIGPGGASKVFFRWEDARDPATGKVRRRRVRIGAWPAVSLADARKAVLEARTLDRAENSPSADLTVKQIAEAYRRDTLSHRKDRSAAWSWGIIETHVLPAKPNARRAVRRVERAQRTRPDIRAVVAAAVRHDGALVEDPGKTMMRAVGGRPWRAVLGEIKAIFAPCAVGRSALLPRSYGAASDYASQNGPDINAEDQRLFAALDLTALLDGTARTESSQDSAARDHSSLYVDAHSVIGTGTKSTRRSVGPSRRSAEAPQEDAARHGRSLVPLPGTALAISSGSAEAGKAPRCS